MGADTSPDTLVVTANRFQQLKPVLAPTDVVTREDIQRWQSKDLNDVMRRLLPRVDISQSGGMGKKFAVCSWHRIAACPALIDGVPMARAGISNAIDIGQLPVSLVQRIEYSRTAFSGVRFWRDWRRRQYYYDEHDEKSQIVPYGIRICHRRPGDGL